MCRETDLAWCAGFFDGEGTTSILAAKRDKYKYIRMSLSQKNRDTLDRFLSIVGVGNIYKSNTREIFQWVVYKKDDVLKVKEDLWKYLSEQKKEQFNKCYVQITNQGI